LALPNGIPSHDTLSDVMGRLNPQAFREAFLAWMATGLVSLAGQHIVIDRDVFNQMGFFNDAFISCDEIFASLSIRTVTCEWSSYGRLKLQLSR